MIIKYKRKISCDNSIGMGIRWLNKNGFYTTGSCSGLLYDHPHSLRDLLYIEFENLSNIKISQLKLVARESGFTIKERKGILRFECKTIDKLFKLDVFDDFIKRLKNNEGALNLRTMGISNWVFDSNNKKLYSVQFYDYDSEGKSITKEILDRIMEIFPLDCLMYKTKHGFQFISFALRYGLRYTKSRAIQITHDLGNQDYWTTSKDLTLRIAPKWNKKYDEISTKPEFLGLLKGHNPCGIRISNKHLDFYYKYMNLPESVFDKYSECDKRQYKMKIYHYRTRD